MFRRPIPAHSAPPHDLSTPCQSHPAPRVYSRMWLITTSGFFSIVSKPGDADDGMLTVRARAAADLDQLRMRYLPELEPTTPGGGTDYPYRARAPKAAIARAAAAIVNDIDYVNFKSRIREDDPEREHIYTGVWSALHRIKERVRK